MIAFGIEAHVAVATNMLALTFMSVGGSLPFLGKGVLAAAVAPLIGLMTMLRLGRVAFAHCAGQSFGNTIALTMVACRLLVFK